MGTSAVAMITGVAPARIASALDSVYAGNLLVMHWAMAVRVRLSGSALLLLGPELDAVAVDSLTNAQGLADRITVIGGEPTFDPADLLAASPFESYELPSSTSDVGAIVGYAVAQLQTLIAAYGDVVALVTGKDEVTYQQILGLLTAALGREDEMEGVLD